MQRINTTNAVPNLFGTGKPGFADGVPGLTPATYLNAAWFNSLQEEIANLIEFAAIALNGNDRTQLRQAVNSLITSALATHRTQSDALYAAKTLPVASEVLRGIVELASNAEALAGADTSRAVTPASLAAVVTAHLAAIDPHPQYRDASNLNAGQIAATLLPVASVPLRSTNIVAGTDLNTILEPGFYTQTANSYAQSGSNYPVPKAGSLVVQRAAGITQQYFTYNDGAPEVYFRAMYEWPAGNVKWSPWNRIIHSANANEMIRTPAARFYFAHC